MFSQSRKSFKSHENFSNLLTEDILRDSALLLCMKRNIWDILAWIDLALITLWLILKTIGIINTPLWLQYAPLYGAVYLAGRAMNVLDRTTNDMTDLKKDIKRVEAELKSDIRRVETYSRRVEIELKNDIRRLDVDIGIIKSRV